MRAVVERWRQDPLVRAIGALDPDPWRSALAVLLGTAALGCAIGLMATSGWLISRAAQQPPVLHLQVAVVATRAFGIGRGVLRYAERLASHDVALRGVTTVRERLYRRLADADPGVVASLRRGDLLARVGADVDTLADLVVRCLLPFAVAATTLAATTVLIGVLLPAAGLVVAVTMLIAGVLAPWAAARAARQAERDGAAARTDLTTAGVALLDHLPELTVAGVVPDRLAEVTALDRRLAGDQERSARSAALAAVVSTSATGAAMLGCLVLGVQATAAGRLDAVLLAVITLTPLAAAEAVAALPAAATQLIRCREAAARVLDLLDAPLDPTLPHRGSPQTGDGTAALPRAGGLRSPHLRADHLACGWPGRPAAVADLDLDLPPGRRIAVVGPSGIGKTTLLLTLAGLLHPRGGRVTLGADGQPRQVSELADVPEDVLRRTVSFTADDAHVFTTTLGENLRVADPGADDDALRAALLRVGLGAWLAGLPRGLDTVLGTGVAGAAGAGLSGGERRRLLLARALLVGAGVLLVDEPAEHVDVASADALIGELLRGELTGIRSGADPQRTGEEVAEERSVIVVTHRLAPLAAADEVIVLDAASPDGPATVAARGTHAWLLAHHPPYARALAAQTASADQEHPVGS